MKSVESKVEKVGAVTDGSLPDVGPGRSDVDTAGNDDAANDPAGGRSFCAGLAKRHRQPECKADLYGNVDIQESAFSMLSGGYGFRWSSSW